MLCVLRVCVYCRHRSSDCHPAQGVPGVFASITASSLVVCSWLCPSGGLRPLEDTFSNSLYRSW